MMRRNTARGADFRLAQGNTPSISSLVRFLLRGFVKRQRVLVYPVERVFLAENLGKDDRLYALDAFPPRRSSARRECLRTAA